MTTDLNTEREDYESSPLNAPSSPVSHILPDLGCTRTLLIKLGHTFDKPLSCFVDDSHLARINSLAQEVKASRDSS